MDGYTTSEAELNAKAQNMIDANEALQDSSRQLATAAETALGVWQGAAANAFGTLMGSFQEHYTTMNNTLMQISEEVGGSAAEYARSEQENADEVSAILNTLDG